MARARDRSGGGCLGIFIALSAEQLIQDLEWRHKIGRAEEQMRLEMAKDDGPAILERLAVFDCINKDLAGIRAAIDRGDSRSTVIETINVAMVREASQATRGLKNQRVVLDATRMGEITNELTRSSALAPCAGELTTLLQ